MIIKGFIKEEVTKLSLKRVYSYSPDGLRQPWRRTCWQEAWRNTVFMEQWRSSVWLRICCWCGGERLWPEKKRWRGETHSWNSCVHHAHSSGNIIWKISDDIIRCELWKDPSHMPMEDALLDSAVLKTRRAANRPRQYPGKGRETE